MRCSMARAGRVEILVLAAAVAAVCVAAPDAGADAEAAPPQTTNLFAQALILGQEIRSRTERLEHFLFAPAVTSDEIEALRKRSNALDLILSGELTGGDRERLRKEQASVRRNLRAAVFAHPVVRQAAADLEADKARLVELNRQIRAIRQERKQRRDQESASGGKAAEPAGGRP